MSGKPQKPFTPPILTETMARLLLEQRHWQEAISVYRQLSRRSPEKAAEYQKEIARIKEFFDPPAPSISPAEEARVKRRIKHLKRLLGRLQKTGLNAAPGNPALEPDP
jgi:hypothetical protein